MQLALLAAESVCEAFDWIAGSRSRSWLTLVVLVVLRWIPLCWTKRLSIDEIYTIEIAGLPHVRDIWHILLTGMEQLPPLTHLVVRAALPIPIDPILSSRLPMAIAFVIMTVVVYEIVRICSSGVHGLAAALLAIASKAFWFSAEARPYGLLLMFAACAFWCWLKAGRSDARYALGFCGAIALAVSSHYYAALLVAPFVLGEVVFFLWERRLRYWALTSMLAGLFPVVCFLPLIQGALNRLYLRPEVVQPSPLLSGAAQLSSAVASYLPFKVLIVLVVVLTVAICRARWLGQWQAGLNASLAEIAAAVAFALVPLWQLLASGITGIFQQRYSVFAVVGIAIVFGFSLAVISSKLASGLAGVILLAFSLSPALTGWRELLVSRDQPASWRQFSIELDLQSTDSPVFVGTSVLYVPLRYYASRDLERRLVYLAGLGAPLSRTDDIDIHTYLVWFGGRTAELSQIRGGGSTMFFLADTWYPSGLDVMVESGANLQLVKRIEDHYLFRLSFPTEDRD